MAIYFDYKTQNPSNSIVHGEITWHNEFPVLAVSSLMEDKGGVVRLFSDEAEQLQSANIPNNPTGEVTAIAWHPLKKILAMGWEGGEMVVWNEKDGHLKEVESLHRATVCILKWSIQGSRLVSADVLGVVYVWKCDSRGLLQIIFQHDLKDPVCKIIFRSLASMSSVDRRGEERRGNVLKTWRPKTGAKRFSKSSERKETQSFFVGSLSGVVYYVNEEGEYREVLQAKGPIKTMLVQDQRDTIVIITDNLEVGHFQVESDGNIAKISTMKLSGSPQEATIVWAGLGTLAVATGELAVRIWNLEEGDNYVLAPEAPHYGGNSEYITCIDYSDAIAILAGGTNRGNVLIWKFSGTVVGSSEDESNWHLQMPSSINGAIKQVKWGCTGNMLAVNAVRDVYVLKEQVLAACCKDQVSAVQVSPTMLSVDLLGLNMHMELRTEFQIKGVCVSVDHVAVWSGKKVYIYESLTSSSQLRTTGNFESDCEIAVLYERTLYLIEGEKLSMRTFQGTLVHTLPFLDNEGPPITLDLSGSFLTVATMAGYLKLWDISGNQAKPHCNPKNLSDVVSDLGEVICAKSNANGSKIAVILADSSLIPDPRLYVWDIEADDLQYLNFSSGKRNDEGVVPPNSASSQRTYREDTVADRLTTTVGKEVYGRMAASFYWDTDEAKLLVCEAKLLSQPKKSGKIVEEETLPTLFSKGPETKDKNPDLMAVSLFTSPETGMIIQDVFPLEAEISRILGLQIPHCYVLLKLESPERDAKMKLVKQKTLRDFAGLDSSDKVTRDAMINFSFYLSVGNMDEAFKAIKLIKSKSVWENMARMCVKNKRLDVASICLGNMGHIRGVRALREALKEPELDARVAILAVHLNMLDEAELLLKNCKRYDILNQLYQDSDRWEEALEIAEKHDRIHLRTTCYNYAKQLEFKGDLSGSIQMYEKSETHRYEVPRMLFDDPQLLENYVVKNNDKDLFRWWAQYMESTGEMEAAIRFYEKAKDYLSLVRVYCYCEQREKACEIANETGDKAACYHLARQYENVDNVKMAIHFFTKCGAYGNAIRMCADHDLEEQVWNLALMAKKKEIIAAARYMEFSDRPNYERAVILYHKAGLLAKAVEVAFRTKQFGALQHIAMDLNSNSDPELLQRCAGYFIENHQFDKAIGMLASAKKYKEALDLCEEKEIHMTEEIAKAMTPEKGSMEEAERVGILEKVADMCMSQGDYHMATKKFTQAGNPVKAMQALLKSGDTEKVIFFATVSRKREVYIMAGNYLQSVNWQKNPDILKHIISFYTKGRALDMLSRFYESCAQVEIDEFQNYDKALGALSEALRCIQNAVGKSFGSLEGKEDAIRMKMKLVKQFIDIKSTYSINPSEAITQCRKLLEVENLDQVVRRGDVYAFMVDHYVHQENFKNANLLLEEMRSELKTNNLAYYVSQEHISAISKALNISMMKNGSLRNEDDSDDGEDEIEENIVGEEIEEEQRFNGHIHAL